MKLRKTISKTSIVLCAAVLAGAPLASNPEAFHLSNIAITAEAASVDWDAADQEAGVIYHDNTISIRPLTNLLNSAELKKDKASGSLWERVNSRHTLDLEEHKFNDYYVLYTKTLTTNLIIMYNPADINLHSQAAITDFKNWIQFYSDYLDELSDNTGIYGYTYKVLILGTTKFKQKATDENGNVTEFYDYLPSGSAAGSFIYIDRAAAIGFLSCISNKMFNHTLLHETSHGYDAISGASDHSKEFFNSEEEVYVNIRSMCALHDLGLDTQPIVYTDYSRDWESCPVYEPMKDSKITKFIKNTGSLKDFTPKYVKISPVQRMIHDSYNESANNFITREAVVFDFCTPLSIWNTTGLGVRDSSNWQNTRAINTVWNQISSTDWNRLKALCVVDITKCTDQQARRKYNQFASAIRSSTFSIIYDCTYYDTKTETAKDGSKTVRITDKAYDHLTKMRTTAHGRFKCCGNMLQVCNMLDILNVSTNYRIYNGNVSMKVGDFYRTVWTNDYSQSPKMRVLYAPDGVAVK